MSRKGKRRVHVGSVFLLKGESPRPVELIQKADKEEFPTQFGIWWYAERLDTGDKVWLNQALLDRKRRLTGMEVLAFSAKEVQ